MTTESLTGSTTTGTDSCKPPRWFWVATIIALLWYLMDTSAFFMRVSMSEEAIASMPANHQHLYRDIPMWVNVVFAGEVFGGVLGCIALLMLKRWAWLLFVVSLLGTLAQTANIWFLTDAISVMGKPAIVMPLIAIIIALIMVVLAMPRPNAGCGQTSKANKDGG